MESDIKELFKKKFIKADETDYPTITSSDFDDKIENIRATKGKIQALRKDIDSIKNPKAKRKLFKIVSLLEPCRKISSETVKNVCEKYESIISDDIHAELSKKLSDFEKEFFELTGFKLAYDSIEEIDDDDFPF